MSFETILSAVLSILALTGAELAGRKLRAAWVVGMVAQSGWVCFTLITGNWGFLISIAGFTVIYIRNYRAWGHDATDLRGRAPGQREAVTGDAGHQMHVQVEDRLGGRRAPAGDQVELAAEALGQTGRARHDRAGDGGVLGEVAHVGSRDDQDVPIGAAALPVAVGPGKEGNGVRPFGDDIGGAGSGRDVAEGAGRGGHVLSEPGCHGAR
jgi:hypothetical protein